MDDSSDYELVDFEPTVADLETHVHSRACSESGTVEADELLASPLEEATGHALAPAGIELPAADGRPANATASAAANKAMLPADHGVAEDSLAALSALSQHHGHGKVVTPNPMSYEPEYFSTAEHASSSAKTPQTQSQRLDPSSGSSPGAAVPASVAVLQHGQAAAPANAPAPHHAHGKSELANETAKATPDESQVAKHSSGSQPIAATAASSRPLEQQPPPAAAAAAAAATPASAATPAGCARSSIGPAQCSGTFALLLLAIMSSFGLCAVSLDAASRQHWTSTPNSAGWLMVTAMWLSNAAMGLCAAWLCLYMWAHQRRPLTASAAASPAPLLQRAALPTPAASTMDGTTQRTLSKFTRHADIILTVLCVYLTITCTFLSAYILRQATLPAPVPGGLQQAWTSLNANSNRTSEWCHVKLPTGFATLLEQPWAAGGVPSNASKVAAVHRVLLSVPETSKHTCEQLQRTLDALEVLLISLPGELLHAQHAQHTQQAQQTAVPMMYTSPAGNGVMAEAPYTTGNGPTIVPLENDSCLDNGTMSAVSAQDVSTCGVGNNQPAMATEVTGSQQIEADSVTRAEECDMSDIGHAAHDARSALHQPVVLQDTAQHVPVVQPTMKQVMQGMEGQQDCPVVTDKDITHDGSASGCTPLQGHTQQSIAAPSDAMTSDAAPSDAAPSDATPSQQPRSRQTVHGVDAAGNDSLEADSLVEPGRMIPAHVHDSWRPHIQQPRIARQQASQQTVESVTGPSLVSEPVLQLGPAETMLALQPAAQAGSKALAERHQRRLLSAGEEHAAVIVAPPATPLDSSVQSQEEGLAAALVDAEKAEAGPQASPAGASSSVKEEDPAGGKPQPMVNVENSDGVGKAAASDQPCTAQAATKTLSTAHTVSHAAATAATVAHAVATAASSAHASAHAASEAAAQAESSAHAKSHAAGKSGLSSYAAAKAASSAHAVSHAATKTVSAVVSCFNDRQAQVAAAAAAHTALLKQQLAQHSARLAAHSGVLLQKLQDASAGLKGAADGMLKNVMSGPTHLAQESAAQPAASVLDTAQRAAPKASEKDSPQEPAAAAKVQTGRQRGVKTTVKLPSSPAADGKPRGGPASQQQASKSSAGCTDPKASVMKLQEQLAQRVGKAKELGMGAHGRVMAVLQESVVTASRVVQQAQHDAAGMLQDCAGDVHSQLHHLKHATRRSHAAAADAMRTLKVATQSTLKAATQSTSAAASQAFRDAQERLRSSQWKQTAQHAQQEFKQAMQQSMGSMHSQLKSWKQATKRSMDPAVKHLAKLKQHGRQRHDKRKSKKHSGTCKQHHH